MIKGAIERATNPQQEFGDIALRYDLLALNAVLCADISSNARLETDVSQFEDVVSQVVVYSNEQAKPLRSLAKKIATRHNSLDHCDNEVFKSAPA